jgi:hypothetical protein
MDDRRKANSTDKGHTQKKHRHSHTPGTKKEREGGNGESKETDIQFI